MVPKERGRLPRLHTKQALGQQEDNMYRCFFSVLQPNQFDCSSKVLGFCPSVGHSLPLEQKGPGCHFHPGDGLGLLWNLKGQRLFLAGAEVQIQARDGVWRQEAGYFFRVCCLRA